MLRKTGIGLGKRLKKRRTEKAYGQVMDRVRKKIEVKEDVRICYA